MGKTKPNDRAQWTLNVNFDIVETDGTLREVTNWDILANNCQFGEIPTGANNTMERTVVIPTKASVIQPRQTAPPLPLLLLLSPLLPPLLLLLLPLLLFLRGRGRR